MTTNLRKRKLISKNRNNNSIKRTLIKKSKATDKTKEEKIDAACDRVRVKIRKVISLLSSNKNIENI